MKYVGCLVKVEELKLFDESRKARLACLRALKLENEMTELNQNSYSTLRGNCLKVCD